MFYLFSGMDEYIGLLVICLRANNPFIFIESEDVIERTGMDGALLNQNMSDGCTHCFCPYVHPASKGQRQLKCINQDRRGK